MVKESTDLLDILRLTLDANVGPTVREQLGAAEGQLRADAALHVRRWFGERAERSLRLIRSIPEGRDVDVDMLSLVGELLMSSPG